MNNIHRDSPKHLNLKKRKTYDPKIMGACSSNMTEIRKFNLKIWENFGCYLLINHFIN